MPKRRYPFRPITDEEMRTQPVFTVLWRMLQTVTIGDMAWALIYIAVVIAIVTGAMAVLR